MEKKGVSEIVATVLLITLTLSTALIVGTFAFRMVNKTLEENSNIKTNIHLVVEKVLLREDSLSLFVTREMGEGDFNQIKIFLYGGDGFLLYSEEEFASEFLEFQTKEFDISAINFDLKEVYQVAVSPIIQSYSGKDLVIQPTSKYDIKKKFDVSVVNVSEAFTCEGNFTSSSFSREKEDFKILGEGENVSLALDMSKDYVLAIKPIKLKCSGFNEKTIKVAVPDNLDSLRAYECLDGICKLISINETKNLGCSSNNISNLEDISLVQSGKENNFSVYDLDFSSNTKEIVFPEDSHFSEIYLRKVGVEGEEWEKINLSEGKLYLSKFEVLENSITIGVKGVVCPKCFVPKIENEFIPNPDSRNAILFVHGLFSFPQKWNREIEQIIKTNQPFQVWTYKYPTGESLEKNSELLRKNLENIEGSFDNLYIVAHSLGGLIVQKAVRDSYDVYGEHGFEGYVNKVRQIILLGTPNEGSPIAKYAELLTRVFERSDNKTFTLNPIISTELYKGLIVPQVPFIDYFVISGVKPSPITKINELFDSSNDGVVALSSSRHVGEEYLNNTCENSWEVKVSHFDLNSDPLVMEIINGLIGKSVKKELLKKGENIPLLGYTHFYDIPIKTCDENLEYVVAGIPVKDFSEEEDNFLICGCGNGICSGIENEENCSFDCSIKNERSFVWIALILIILIYLVSFLIVRILKKKFSEPSFDSEKLNTFFTF